MLRRLFVTGLAGLFVAPAIVRASSLMSVKAPEWGYRMLPDGRLEQWGYARAGSPHAYPFDMDVHDLTVQDMAGGHTLCQPMDGKFMSYGQGQRIKWTAVGSSSRHSGAGAWGCAKPAFAPPVSARALEW